jgi:hypothetical protein
LRLVKTWKEARLKLGFKHCRVRGGERFNTIVPFQPIGLKNKEEKLVSTQTAKVVRAVW